jgi:hypothetical protein
MGAPKAENWLNRPFTGFTLDLSISSEIASNWRTWSTVYGMLSSVPLRIILSANLQGRSAFQPPHEPAGYHPISEWIRGETLSNSNDPSFLARGWRWSHPSLAPDDPPSSLLELI